ncbi:MAG: flagellar basal-body rod protein FlgF [Desulfovibrio sp.]|nr:MAG: flagellar basal-body rod protein FlgF [Desulfovibrio sp.]
MQDSMYSALFGALTNEHRLNIIANNLANANTTGYKQDRLAFKDVMVHFAHDTIMEARSTLRSPTLLPDPTIIAKPRLAMARTDFSQGGLRESGNPLDVAIMGEGFFKVQVDGNEYYTRNGNFHRSAEGTLVNSEGYPVMGASGAITLPQGDVYIDSAGRILVNGEETAALSVVSVDNLDALEKVGHNLFQLPEASDVQEIAATDAQIEQGYLEAANINVVEEMVNMIETQRAYEAYTKIIKSTNETDQKLLMKVGRAR